MRVFVLCTGRSASTTFAEAASHITNYTSGHQTRWHLTEGRLDYPDNHIEVDNRLAWFLGSLDRVYGDDPLYVYLYRNLDAVADSYASRYLKPISMLRSFAHGVVAHQRPLIRRSDRVRVARLMAQTVVDNIELFLKDKPNVLRMVVDDMEGDWDDFWYQIGAEGDPRAALDEWAIRHNRRVFRGEYTGFP